MNTKGCVTCNRASHILYAREDRKEIMSLYCHQWKTMFSDDEPCNYYQKSSNQ